MAIFENNEIFPHVISNTTDTRCSDCKAKATHFMTAFDADYKRKMWQTVTESRLLGRLKCVLEE